MTIPVNPHGNEFFKLIDDYCNYYLLVADEPEDELVDTDDPDDPPEDPDDPPL
jgi:hypothetical protein